MGESLGSHGNEIRNIPRVEGSRFITAGPNISYSDSQTLQASLALQAWFKKHTDETRKVDFVNPRDSDKSLQVDALVQWNDDLGGGALRGRFRAFLNALETSEQTVGPFDLAQEGDRETLLARIRSEQGIDPASSGTLH
jgi:hypothetical protein